MKFFGLLKKGRRTFFTLALFVLVFVAASVVKIQAAGNVTGWLWGGGAQNTSINPYPPADGTNTNLGWISLNRSDCDPDLDGVTEGGMNNATYPNCPDAMAITVSDEYGVQIPDSEGQVIGYGWSENLGWIQFNPAGPYPTSGCNGTCPDFSTKRNASNMLEGWARFISIRNALAIGNSGGWEGWIKLGGNNYGIDVTKLDGTGNNKMYAWSNELGWIDFSRAKYTPPSPPPPSPSCVTGRSTCNGVPIPNCNKDVDCINSTSCSVVDATHWTCSNGVETTSPCPAIVNYPEVGKCGPLNGGSFCNVGSISDSMLCDTGTSVPDKSNIDTSEYNVEWTCGGSSACGGSPVSCSAEGKKSCGWIETN